MPYADRDERLAYMREWHGRTRPQARVTAFAHYGGACQCCGEAEQEFLCIDHVDGNGRQDREGREALGLGRISGVAMYAWLIRNNFPPGFRLLCWNCNRSMALPSHRGVCAHKRWKPTEDK